jgi:phosphate:Na+ symporter
MSTVIQLFFSVGVCYYGVYWLNSAIMQFPLDFTRDMLLKVYKSNIRSSAFGAITSAFFTDNLAIFVLLGSLMSIGSLALKYAYLVLVWSCVGVISLVYVMPLSIDPFVYFFLGFVCFQVTSVRWGRHRNLITGLFGLALILFGVMSLYHTTLELREAPWFMNFIQMSEGSIFIPLILGFILQIGLRSVFLVILVGATILELKVYNLDALLAYFTGAAIGSTVHWAILHQHSIREFKQLSALLVIYYATCSVIFLIPVLIQQATGYVDMVDFLNNSGISSKNLSANIMGIGLVTAALITSILKPYYEKKILEYWPTFDITEDPGAPRFLEKQALNTPEIALNMVQYEQVRLLTPMLSYLEILRNKLPHSLEEIERVRQSTLMLEGAIQNFLTELSGNRLNSLVLERFLNMSIRQKVYRSLGIEIYEFAKTMISDLESTDLEDLKNNLMEALDVTIMNLKDVMEIEGTASQYKNPMLEVLLADRSDVIENQRKAFLSKESRLGLLEKKQILDSTLHFERALWLVEELVQLAYENRDRHEKDLETKKRWLNELTSSA